MDFLNKVSWKKMFLILDLLVLIKIILEYA